MENKDQESSLSTPPKLSRSKQSDAAQSGWLKRHYLHGVNIVIRKDLASDVRKIKDYLIMHLHWRMYNLTF
jgi:hypothetical protein